MWTRVLLNNYLYGCPTHRFCQELEHQGFHLSQGTITDGLQRLKGLFEPLRPVLSERQMTEKLFQGEEMRWEVCEEVEGKTGHRWYRWVMKSVSVGYYRMAPGRGADVPQGHFAELRKDLLKVVLVCDRYSAYKSLALACDELILAFCWAHVLGDARAAKDGRKQPVEFRFRPLRGGEGAQGGVLAGHDFRACAKSRHLAVATVGEPGALDGLTHCGTLRQRERVIGRLASDDRRRQRQAERSEPRQRDLPLRQIGAMLLAVAELAQPVGRHVGSRCRGVEAHHAALQVIDTQHRLVQGAFTRAPAFRNGQGIERRRSPIIGQVPWFHRAAETPTQGALVGCGPGLDPREPVVALGEDEGQPDDRRFAETQALPLAMGEEVVVQ